jgi:hypothetical protein
MADTDEAEAFIAGDDMGVGAGSPEGLEGLDGPR